MHALHLWLAAVAAAAQLAVLADLALGGRRLRLLRDVPTPAPSDPVAAVSVVVAARNEARGVEAGVRSLLALHAAAEVIVVDDRSDDETGAILNRIAAGHPRLRVIHLAELPPGWLGKNHALWRGAAESAGELLLFTDADVVMEPTALSRAAAYLAQEGLDHVTVAPRVHMPGALLQAFAVAFGLFFSVYARPWKARDPRSRRHVGIGAFNLLRAEAYRAAGTHRAIAMRPDDDMKLGKIVKKAGLRQDFLVGGELVGVEWYASVRELVEGLKKNAFAGLEYSVPAVVASTLLHLLVYTLPWIGVLAAHGAARALYGVAVAVMLLLFAGAARVQRIPVRYALLFPAACLLFVYIVWNAAAYTLRTGGIEWRGTRYPLAELRANRV
ncbi:MAG: glycosyl transferase family 2 [Gemmatimonadetes bacterium]|nr:glycosyl transferase family 2 [Gemmatimonadota bacterium]